MKSKKVIRLVHFFYMNSLIHRNIVVRNPSANAIIHLKRLYSIEDIRKLDYKTSVLDSRSYSGEKRETTSLCNITFFLIE